MANYDFQNLLSPLDFEHLVRDLLSKDLGIELSAFTEGKDGGIDLRHSTNKSKSLIVQCKRVKNLSKEDIDKEFIKINKINPKEYYFVCSKELSVEMFDYIKLVFKQWMNNDDKYIYTRSKLNNLLDSNLDIHQKNYKLWLNSSTIFNTLINQPLFQRAKSLIGDIKKDNVYYVKNDSLNKAFEILNNNQFIIISGIPGIGKSTLAKLILWEYLQKGFEVIEIRKVIECEQILIEDSENNQVFYYDDFLGENFLKYDVIEGRSNDLVQLINRIKNSKNKILVMTTREYILNQAKEVYEKLDSSELNLAKQTLDLSSYSKRIKSLILYNHLFYSNISNEYIKSIIESETYKDIINHKNYSPRIIEQLTIKLNNVSVEDYPKEFINSLDKPFGIWNKAFNSQISKGSQTTLFLLMSISGPILLSDLRIAMNNAYNLTKQIGLDFRPFDFQNYLKELENSFIKISITDKNNHYIDFLNPSIKDFMLSLIKDDIQVIKLLISSSLFYNQFAYTTRYLAENFHENLEITENIDKAILANFDNFYNPSKIYSTEKENIITINVIQKIDGLKYYLQHTKNQDVISLFIDKFKTINLRSLFYNDEKKYIEFYLDHIDLIDIEFESILDQVIENISWYDGVKNLFILRDYNKSLFEKFVSNNLDRYNNKIKDSIIKEIEFIDSKDGLDYFKSILSVDFNLSKYTIPIEEFETYFEEKETKIIELEKTNEDSKNINVEIEKIVEKIDEEFDEDSIFKMEMFEKE
ncbi:restriction endonuclease [Flavobacterium sp. HXWNR29]|uniref:restriction endonuclease n=1 Tax=Flavobacterium odoriferum TaxID=2946604 RepID=UPI0021CB4D6F|nr:restriction endonuclease [Flavobacterium sp. HXWNR29]MCU4188637.1 restriction endonuclease [Flavobacterium sp. HXWNR29]